MEQTPTTNRSEGPKKIRPDLDQFSRGDTAELSYISLRSGNVITVSGWVGVVQEYYLKIDEQSKGERILTVYHEGLVNSEGSAGYRTRIGDCVSLEKIDSPGQSDE